MAPVITSTIFVRPHRRPPENQVASLESQTIQINQDVCGQALRDVLNKNDDNRIMHVPFFSLMKTALLARRDTRGLKDFSGTYLGYRLSSSKGELIRYYITIDAKSNNNVSFVNSYHRNEIKWTCRGNGIIHDSNLYLIGQAVDESNEFKHRGYRLFCLHKFMNTNYLYGIVTSHDTIGAIAAKTLIIPISEHDFDASATGDYGRLLREEKSRQGIENNNTQAAAQAIVDADVRFNARHSLSPESFIDLINIQIDASIRSAKNKSENDFTLLELIHNITGTTLKGYRKDRLIDRLHENKDYNESYENIIGRLVEIAATDKLNIEDLFEKMAADYIDARALRSASAPPG